MSSPVKLYVYDLSNGLARQLSRQFVGRQIDGIWHTSVVVFGKEIFYGKGISIVPPGQSHHGRPLQTIDMGVTDLDEETFNEYLSQMREHYTADKYHLLDFNCNSFTSDCIGFLTGGSIPAFIKDLPSDFLSTPFGAALRPTIDSMFQRPSPDAQQPAQPSASQIDSVLSSVASRAAAPNQSYLPTPAPTSPSTPTPASTVTAPIRMATNPASMNGVVSTHKAVVAFFTSQTCPPCKMIEPVFERLAEEKTKSGNDIAFVKVDMGVGLGGRVASDWGVRVTPTFLFFLSGKKIHEFKGADAPELRTQIDLLIFQAFPPHPHTRIALPAVQAISLNPIIFSQVPALETVVTKLTSFISASSLPQQSRSQVTETISQIVLPYLKSRLTPAVKSPPLPSATTVMLTSWLSATMMLVDALPLAELFPLVDMWRLAFLDPVVGTWCASLPASIKAPDPIAIFLKNANGDWDNSPRSYTLTLLRLLSNALSSPIVARRLISDDALTTSHPNRLTSLLVSTLLHQDAAVRTAAASVAFNVASYLQKGRVEQARGIQGGHMEDEDEAWEVEMVSAIVEAIGREKQSGDVVHRLTASLAFLLRLSPFYDQQLVPLLEVLQVRAALKAKLEKGGCGEMGVEKKEVRQLVLEVAEKLCP